MKKERIVDIVFFALAILWCGVIFGFSSQNGDESGHTSSKVCQFVAENFVFDFDEMSHSEQQKLIEGMEFFVRKTAHFCAYALLGFLIAMGLREKKPLVKGALTLGFVAVYAISDELHQRFVSDRNGNILDVLLDSTGGLFGALCAIILWIIIVRLTAKRRGNSG